ncbi:unnamed protein product [Rotaria sordida]|uniref:DUF659 domain-containing protein n=1 Tax=Rotaria sordida TaxID=392033 RepID=A0A815VSC3_9BILA|nr:unnamed protein product [Rotaria sordida]CAF1534183.1 unnamed protein product [Rotaria sordida]CAF4132136.1 unnamed protein product [Rotaria sordida]CAF4176850.1 unnamed protein product [Rotaria sordida]
MAPPPTDISFSTSITPISTTPRRIVKAKQTKEFSGNHTAERIVERLEDLCNKWPISDKIICLVSDNCSTMRKVEIDFGKGIISFIFSGLY